MSYPPDGYEAREGRPWWVCSVCGSLVVDTDKHTQDCQIVQADIIDDEPETPPQVQISVVTHQIQDIVDNHYKDTTFWVEIEGWRGARIGCRYGFPKTVHITEPCTLHRMRWYDKSEGGEVIFGPIWATAARCPVTFPIGTDLVLPNRIEVTDTVN